MDGHRCFGLASMYNLTKTTIVSGESGWDVPTTHWQGKSGCPPKEECEDSLNSKIWH